MPHLLPWATESDTQDLSHAHVRTAPPHIPSHHMIGRLIARRVASVLVACACLCCVMGLHVLCCLSHGSRHSAWNACRHGITLVTAPMSNESRHTTGVEHAHTNMRYQRLVVELWHSAPVVAPSLVPLLSPAPHPPHVCCYPHNLVETCHYRAPSDPPRYRGDSTQQRRLLEEDHVD